MRAKVSKNCPVIQRPVSSWNNPPQKTPGIPLFHWEAGVFLAWIDPAGCKVLASVTAGARPVAATLLFVVGLGPRF